MTFPSRQDGGPAGAAAVDRRVLPAYAAGSLEARYVIDRFQEHVQVDTLWEDHSHPTHELIWNERGASQITVDARTWTISPSVGMWMPAGVLHSGWAVAGTRCNFSHFDIHAVPSISAVPATVEVSPLLRLLLERLAAPTIGPDSRRIAEAAVLDILTPAPHEVVLHMPESRLLAPMVATLQQNPGLQRPLTDWARELGVSARTITRAFRAETGSGFSQWVAALRAQKAITMLAHGEEVEEIVAALGYGSASAFGAAFKRSTGFTPSTFRAH